MLPEIGMDFATGFFPNGVKLVLEYRQSFVANAGKPVRQAFHGVATGSRVETNQSMNLTQAGFW